MLRLFVLLVQLPALAHALPHAFGRQQGMHVPLADAAHGAAHRATPLKRKVAVVAASAAGGGGGGGCMFKKGMDLFGYDLPGGGGDALHRNVPNAAACCALCRRNPKCFAWGWNDGSTAAARPYKNQCFLKRAAVKYFPNPAVVSGARCDVPFAAAADAPAADLAAMKREVGTQCEKTAAAVGGAAAAVAALPAAAATKAAATNVELLVGVLSARGAVQRRDAIRAGWGSAAEQSARAGAGARARSGTALRWKLLFVVGTAAKQDADQGKGAAAAAAAATLRAESRRHGDMLLVPGAGDGPREAPRLVAALWRAAVGDGSVYDASLVLKASDDAFVDVALLMATFEVQVGAHHARKRQQEVAGEEGGGGNGGNGGSGGGGGAPHVAKLYAGIGGALSGSVLRDVGGAYSESAADQPAARWRPYCSGRHGYLLSADVVACFLREMAKPAWRELHVEDAAAGELAHRCGVRPRCGAVGGLQVEAGDRSGAMRQCKIVGAMAELAGGKLPTADYEPYEFSRRATRKVGELRAASRVDLRHAQCAARLPAAAELAAGGWDSSVVVTFVDEEPTTLVRTVRTILKNSPPALLKEIILVNDGSSEAWKAQLYPSYANAAADEAAATAATLRAAGQRQPPRPLPILEYIVAILPAKIRVVELQGRQGFIRARAAGIKAATGRTYTIMESHCETQPGWLEPLIAAVRENPETVANPVISQLSHGEFRLVPGVPIVTMDYNVVFEMTWGQPGTKLDLANVPLARKHHPTGQNVPWGNTDVGSTQAYMPFATPIHAGGIYTASKAFYEYVQGYDPGMTGFSSENLDFAFRTWLCGKTPQGGRVVVVPCSVVAHVYRMQSPKPSKDLFSVPLLLQNKRRMIDAWLDPRGDGRGYGAAGADGERWGTCFDGERCKMPNLYKQVTKARLDDLRNTAPGPGLDERKKWIREHCKPFSWLMKNIAPPSGGVMVADKGFRRRLLAA